jgi:hypothetical protein
MLPNVYEEHEGNPWIERLAPVGLIVAVVLVIFFQQFLRQEHGATLKTPLPEIRAYEVAREPVLSSLVVESKLLLKEREFARSLRDKEYTRDSEKQLAEIEKTAVSRVDRFRFAIVAWEIKGAAGAVERLEALEKEADSGGPLATEITWMLNRYRQVEKYEQYQAELAKWEADAKTARSKGKKPAEKPALIKGAPPAVEDYTSEFKTSLVARHGFFGELALVQGPGTDEGARHALLGGLINVINFQEVLTIVHVCMFLAGLVLLSYFNRRMRRNPDEIGLDDPRAPTTVYLEVFSIFALMFSLWVALQVLLLGDNSTLGMVLSEVTIWAAPLCLLWVYLRGVTWTDMLHDLGLHKGSGIFKEVAVGVGAACAVLPVESFANRFIYALTESGDAHAGPVTAPPSMFQVPDETTWVLMWVSTLGGVLWAPVVEEIFFRGALQRWLRVRLSWLPTVIIVSIVFGAYHPYTLSGLLSVGFAGVGMGMVREWRKCLIAPMVMHAIHNGMISLQELGFLHALG